MWRVGAIKRIDLRGKGTLAVPVVLSFGFFVLYLLTQTRYYTYDAVAYAMQIRHFAEEGRAGWLFHPHHLLFNALGYLSWRVLSLVGLSIDPLGALQCMNAFFAALGLVLFYSLLRRGGFHVARGGSADQGTGAFVAFAAALILGSSYGYWLCATDGRVIIPGLVALVLVLGLAWGMLDRPGVGQCLAASGATVLAVTMHQSHGMLMIPVLGAILICPATRRKRLTLSTLYLSACLAGIVMAYAGIGVAIKGIRDYAGFNAWVLAYAHDGRWWSFDIIPNLVSDVQALTHAFIAPQLTAHRWANWNSKVLMMMLVAVAVMTLGCTLTTRSLACRWTIRCPRRWREMLVLLSAAVPYAAFFTVWTPGYLVFWIPVAIAVLIALALAVDSVYARQRWAWRGGLLMIALVLVYTNLPTIRLDMQRGHNPDLVLCDLIRDHARPGDMVVITGTYAPVAMPAAYAEVYLPYFNRVSVKTVAGECKLFHGDTDHAIRSVHGVSRMRMQAGHRVFVLQEFFSEETWDILAKRWALPDDARDRIVEGYQLQRVESDGRVGVYRLVR